MKKIAITICIYLSLVSVVLAQSSPGLYDGQVPTPAQWNSYFAAKQDLLGYTPLNKAGDQMLGRLTTAASGTTSGFTLSPGVTPTSLRNGDMWMTTLGLYAQINGVTTGPYIAAANFSAPLSFSGSSVGLNLDSSAFGVSGGNLALATGGVAYGAPTGGQLGAGKINVAGGFYVNGSVLGGVSSITCGNGLSGGTVNVTGTCAMYFDPGSITNCTLSASVSLNALTIALKTQGGSDPSASVPCFISFRSATQTNGGYTTVAVTSATSFSTAASGSTFGAASGVPFRLWVTAWNNAGTVLVGLSNQTALSGGNVTNIYPLGESGVSSSTACAACGTATSAGVFYTPSALTSVATRVLGYVEWSSGLTTAGTFDAGPTLVQAKTPAIRMPGETVQVAYASYGFGVTRACSTTPVDVTGSTISLTPRSPANAVRLDYSAAGVATAGGSGINTQLFTQLAANGTPVGGQTGIGAVSGVGTNTETDGTVHAYFVLRPNSGSAQSYTLRSRGLNSSGNCNVTGGYGEAMEIQG